MQKLLIYMALITCFNFFEAKLHAQTKSLIIEDKIGTKFLFDIEKSTVINFKSGNFLVSNTNSPVSIPITDIRSIKFENNSVASNSLMKFEKFNNVKLFPNPVNDICQLVFETKSPQLTNIKIFNVLGELMHQETMTCVNGENLVNLKTQELPSGFYLCNLQYGSEIQVINFIKN